MRSISPERLSELLAHIYDCVLQPETWSIALREICRELDLLHGVLGYYETPSGNALLRVRYGLGREWSDRMPEYEVDLAAYWGGIEQIRAYPIGEVVAHSIAQPDIDIRANRYATEWCAPQGIADMIGITVAQDTIGLGCLMLASNRKMANSHEADLDELRLLVPHVPGQ